MKILVSIESVSGNGLLLLALRQLVSLLVSVD